MLIAARRALPLLAAAGALAGCTSGIRGTRPAPVAAPPAPHTRAALRHAIDSMVGAPQFRNAHWGVLIVHAASGDTLYSHNAGKLFMPASNQKLLTAAVALAQLGPAFRFRTTYAVRPFAGVLPIRDGVLQGDLVVIGRGDPTVSDHMLGDAMLALRAAADSLAARGVRRIAGRVVRGGDAFPDANYGFGWGWDDFDYPYSAGVDELLFNEGFSSVVVRAGVRPGDPAVAQVGPVPFPAVRVAAVTMPAPRVVGAGDVPPPDSARRSVTNLSLTADATYGASLSGTIAVGDSATLTIAHRDVAAAYLAALTAALTARGIVVDGGADASPAALVPLAGGPLLDTLFTMQSPPLAEILPRLQKPSQNQIAEVLLKTLGLERTGVGSADSGRRVVESQLVAWGADPEGFAVRDGSGLSRHDYVSPETLVRVLEAMRRAPTFASYYDALPVAGVDGTIANRMRGTPAQGNVRAKTGYVDRARSLSGYVHSADGELLLFSVLCNNWTTPVRAVERVQDEIAVRLATLPVRQR